MMFIEDLTKPDIATMEIFQHMRKHCRLLNYDLVHPERLWLANRDPGLGVGCMKNENGCLNFFSSPLPCSFEGVVVLLESLADGVPVVLDTWWSLGIKAEASESVIRSFRDLEIMKSGNFHLRFFGCSTWLPGSS